MKHGFSFLPAEALMRCGFLEGLAYRKNLFTSLLANFIQTAVSYYVWKTIFGWLLHLESDAPLSLCFFLM